MRSSVYLETTIPSYLTAWPSRDLIRAAHQQGTREWWAKRDRFDLFVSELVLNECRAGDPRAAAERLVVLADVPLLDQPPEVGPLVKQLLREVPLPNRATVDATHIAVAALHGIDYLLTWNCRHIANATLRPQIEAICRAAGCRPPTICTPSELSPEDFPNV